MLNAQSMTLDADPAPVAKCSTLAEREAAVAVAVAAADTVCILFCHLPEYLLSREFVNTARRYTR